MNDKPTPEHFLARILQVAQLLLYTESSPSSEKPLRRSAKPDAPSIIVSKDHSGGNLEKKPFEQEKL
ncbi:MAG: hypothetical protein K8L97_11615 [Anaerolineae bacterium]|nr:hypothetical protein [Anaerolineae bacterium]